MQQNNLETGKPTSSFGQIFRDIGVSTKGLVTAEIELIKVELRSSADTLTDHLTQIAIFGVVTVLGMLPFLAFAIIGLGVLLDDRYWLSSLIVSLVIFAAGGTALYRAVVKLKSTSFALKRSGEALAAGAQTAKRKVQDVTEAAIDEE